MLTPDQINQIAQSRGDTVVNPNVSPDATQAPTPSWGAAFAPAGDTTTVAAPSIGAKVLGTTPATPSTSAPTPGGFLGKIGNFIGGSKLAQGLGQTLDNIGIDGKSAQDKNNESLQQSMDLQTKLLEKIKSTKDAGGDTTRLEAALQGLNETIAHEGGQAADLGTQGLSDKEVIGSGLQLAANAIPGLDTGASGVLTKGAPALASTLGQKVLEGAATGYVNDVGNKLQNDTTDGAQGKDFTPGLGTAIGAALPLVFKGLSNLFDSSGESILTKAIRPTAADTADGFVAANVKKYGVGGSLGTMLEKTNDKMDELATQLNSTLADSDAKVNLNDVFDKTSSDLGANKLKTFGSNTSMDNALTQLKGEIANAAEDGNVSIPEAQQVKQASGSMGAWLFGQNDPDATARQQVYNAFYKNLKTEIEKNSPDGVQNINNAISELIPIRNAVFRRIPVAARNGAVGLTDMISLAASLSHPGALAFGALGRATKSGAVGNALQNLGTKIGSEGALRAGEILGTK
jgi:hypothetical protein